MPAYTYLLQVLPQGGEKWANLLEPRTGTPLDGTFGVVEVPESSVPGIAKDIMTGFAGMGLRLRVSFWVGRRVNDKLYASEVFRTVHDDGTVVDAETLVQITSDGSAQSSGDVRPDCPYAPHDGVCGHQGECRFAHHGRECDAVRPVCPACFDEARPWVVAGIVSRVRQSGELNLRCSSCERLSFRFDAESICASCHWLVPDVNEQLADRFAANGGDFASRRGSCPSCGDQMPQPPDPFAFSCPACGHSVVLHLRSIRPGGDVVILCPNRDCGESITMPRTMWCRQCGDLRPLTVVRKLILAANDAHLVASSNVREDEDVRLARRLAAAAESSTRSYPRLSAEQKSLLTDSRYLDAMAFAADPDEWIRGVAEIRAAGHRINQAGGMRAMQEMHRKVLELGTGYRNAARHIELYWDGIGDWRG
jgi:hypothetical protein